MIVMIQENRVTLFECNHIHIQTLIERKKNVYGTFCDLDKCRLFIINAIICCCFFLMYLSVGLCVQQHLIVEVRYIVFVSRVCIASFCANTCERAQVFRQLLMLRLLLTFTERHVLRQYDETHNYFLIYIQRNSMSHLCTLT